VVFARLLFWRHVTAVSGDCITGCVDVIGRFEFLRELVRVFSGGVCEGVRGL